MNNDVTSLRVTVLGNLIGNSCDSVCARLPLKGDQVFSAVRVGFSQMLTNATVHPYITLNGCVTAVVLRLTMWDRAGENDRSYIEISRNTDVALAFAIL